jgi:hypothetical protein
MKKHGLKLNGEFQIVNDMAVLPAIHFNPNNRYTGRCHKSERTYSIHHYAASWLTEEERALHFSLRTSLVAKFLPIGESLP